MGIFKKSIILSLLLVCGVVLPVFAQTITNCDGLNKDKAVCATDEVTASGGSYANAFSSIPVTMSTAGCIVVIVSSEMVVQDKNANNVLRSLWDVMITKPDGSTVRANGPQYHRPSVSDGDETYTSKHWFSVPAGTSQIYVRFKTYEPADIAKVWWRTLNILYNKN
ncbi:MAG: hypothetical protein HY999_03125 [Nitrospinae bacterium]|nr:hypothetical protein [Nitrospinota bacterium]